MKDLRVGVIGVGSLGQHHARVYAELPGTRLVGVADVDATRASAVAAKYGCQAFTDFRSLIGHVEAVSVAVPTPLHHPVAKACLAAGIHVLVEKPIAVTLEEGRDLVAFASTQRMTLQVGHIERFNAAFRATRGAIKAPRLIECRRWAPFTSRGADVDVVLDLMIHDLDLVLELVGSPVQEVRAQGVSSLSPTTDVAQARIRFQNGCVASFSVNRLAESKVRELRIWEPDGYVVVDLGHKTGIVARRVMSTAGVPELLTEPVRGDDREPLKLELEAFLEAVRAGTAPLVSGQQGVAALELAQAIMNEIAGNGS